MSISVFGINHKTADLAVREKMSFANSRALDLLQDVLADTAATQAFVISTCNRTEIYSDVKSVDRLIEILLRHSTLQKDVLVDASYQYHGQLAIEHLMRVAGGLDSMIVGEAEILGQVKSAFAFADENNFLGSEFKHLAREIFTLAKQIRTTTQVGACPVSIASIASRKAIAEFGQLEKAKILLLGAGDTIQLLAKYLAKQTIATVTIACRNVEKAKALTTICPMNIISLTDLHDALVDIDIVFAATTSQVPLIGKGAVESALKRRPERPMVLIDMAVPRDIENEVDELAGVKLSTIDDLKSVAQSNQESREHATVKANELIGAAAKKYIDWVQNYDTVQGVILCR